MKISFSTRLVILASSLLAVSSQSALLIAQNTWDGGGADNNSNTAINWNNNVVPTGGTLIFAGNTRPTVVWNGINSAAPINLAGFTFSTNAAAFQINSGTQNAVQFVSGGTPLLNSSSNLQTLAITPTVFFNGTKTFDAGASGLALNGGIIYRGDSMTTGQINRLDLIGSGNSTTSSISRVGGFAGTSTTSLVKNGSGKWTITGNVTDTGATTISGGTLEYQGSISSSSITNNAALIFNSGSNQSYGNGIGGNGTLTKQGAGTLTLSGANIYTGATTISGGTLEVQGSIASSGITNNAALIFNSGSNQSYGNAISGNGTLTKQGGGTLTLSGANSYMGATTISGGTLRLSSVGTSNAVSIANHSFENPSITNWVQAPTLAAQGGTGWTFTGNSGVAKNTWFVNTPPDGVQAGYIQQTAGTISQAITAGADGYYQINFQAQGRGGSFGPEGVIVQVDGVTVGTWTAADVSQSVWNSFSAPVNLTAGSHTLTFLGNNTLGGDRSVSIDNVRMNQPIGSLPTNTAVNLTTSGATLDMNFTNQTIGSLTGVAGTSVINGALVIGGSDTTTFAGVISGGSSLSISGSGTQTLSGTNTYTGATLVNAGTLKIDGAGSINTTSGISVAAGSALIYNSSNALTVAPTLAGNGLGNRAVLGGIGTINSAVTLDDLGDVLSPGNSPGIQVYAPAQSWDSFSYDWDLNDFTDTPVAGINYDLLSLTSTLELTGGIGDYQLNILGLTAGNVLGLVPNFVEVNRQWTILTSAGITGFNAANWTINAADFQNAETGTWSIAQSGGDLVLSYTTAIPEPSAALIGGLGVLALLRRRRN